jgi:nephrocystin-4
MLILQLEYEATFLVANLGKQTMQIILGWLPVYLNDKIGMP